MASVLLGKYAPIDLSDGCGMNLLNLGSREWDEGLLGATAPGLKARLGDKPVPSHTSLGPISPYFTSTYGIPASASVIAWSGDNPCSVAGLGLSTPGDIAVSLGTSDTMFGILPKPSPGLEGHIFVNPMDPASYMAMLCYKNGSLTRERIMRGSGGGTWEGFGALLASTPPGNGGALGFYIDAPEITPAIPKAGVRRFKAGAPVPAFTPGEEVRAVVEGQFLSMRIHGESVGITAPKRLIATGGASGNAAILQVLADVFGAPVYIAAQTDSASLGAAVRALHGWEVARAPGGKFSSVETMRPVGAGGLKHAADPRPAATAAYTALLPAYKAAEKVVCAEK
jgi:xylulokinase